MEWIRLEISYLVRINKMMDKGNKSNQMKFKNMSSTDIYIYIYIYMHLFCHTFKYYDDCPSLLLLWIEYVSVSLSHKYIPCSFFKICFMLCFAFRTYAAWRAAVCHVPVIHRFNFHAIITHPMHSRQIVVYLSFHFLRISIHLSPSSDAKISQCACCVQSFNRTSIPFLMRLT